MVVNNVIVNMDNIDFWYCVVSKEQYHVILLCDLKNHICYTFGGANLSTCKNMKKVSNNNELYDVFMRKIGKMCKKDIDHNGHYFSDLDCYVKDELISRAIRIKIKQIMIKHKLR